MNISVDGQKFAAIVAGLRALQVLIEKGEMEMTEREWSIVNDIATDLNLYAAPSSEGIDKLLNELQGI